MYLAPGQRLRTNQALDLICAIDRSERPTHHLLRPSLMRADAWIHSSMYASLEEAEKERQEMISSEVQGVGRLLSKGFGTSIPYIVKLAYDSLPDDKKDTINEIFDSFDPFNGRRHKNNGTVFSHKGELSDPGIILHHAHTNPITHALSEIELNAWEHGLGFPQRDPKSETCLQIDVYAPKTGLYVSMRDSGDGFDVEEMHAQFIQKQRAIKEKRKYSDGDFPLLRGTAQSLTGLQVNEGVYIWHSRKGNTTDLLVQYPVDVLQELDPCQRIEVDGLVMKEVRLASSPATKVHTPVCNIDYGAALNALPTMIQEAGYDGSVNLKDFIQRSPLKIQNSPDTLALAMRLLDETTDDEHPLERKRLEDSLGLRLVIKQFETIGTTAHQKYMRKAENILKELERPLILH